MAAFNLPTLVTVVSTVATFMATGAVVGRWLKMYPLEAAIVNACHSLGQAGGGLRRRALEVEADARGRPCRRDGRRRRQRGRQGTLVHGSVRRRRHLELALRPLQADFASTSSAHEGAGPNDRAMLDIAVAAEVNLVGDPVPVAADAARAAANSPSAIMAAAASISGPKRVERALACTRALIDLFAGSGPKEGHQALTVFLYGRMIRAAAEMDDHLNRGRNMDTRTPEAACAFVM